MGLNKGSKFGESFTANPEPTENGGVETMIDNKSEFKGVVIGMVLGDGTLMKQYKNENSKLMMHHGKKQYEYLLWKKSLLDFLTSSNIHETETGYQLQTRRHPFYSKLRERMYINGRKTVDEHVMKTLSELGLAIWFQDDGCFCKCNRWENDYSIHLYTNHFSKPEVDLIQYWIKKRFGIDFTVYKTYDKRKDKTYFFLSLRDTNKEKKIEQLVSIVKDYIHPIMTYKLGSYEPILENKDKEIVRHSSES